MAITETYVDPAIAGASGAGTVGDPYGDLQHALDTMTRDATNGDRINIKAGTDEVLAAALDLSTYGEPTEDAPLVFQGYATAAEDGGIGGISGAATYSVFNSTTLDYISFIDLHCHNSGAAVIIRADRHNNIINCEIDNSSGNGLQFGSYNIVSNTHIHNCGTSGISAGAGIFISHCYFENGANDFSSAISAANFSGIVINCIFNLDGSSNGIVISSNSSAVSNNTVYSSSGTGSGIKIAGNAEDSIVLNNYVEGFSGVGGIGIDIDTGSAVSYYQSNRWYNNTTNESLSGAVFNDNDNSATAASALTNPGGGDFSVGTDLKAGAYPTSFKGTSTNQYMDIGAAQRREQAIVIAGRHNVLLRR